MTGTVPTILPGSITAMTALEQRPVYFLRMNGAAQPNLVVKGDAPHQGDNLDAQVSVKWGSKIMKNVNNELVNTKVMTPAEINVFKLAARVTFGNAVNGNPYRNVAPECTQNYLWVKMPMVPGNSLSDAEFLKKKEDGFKRVVPGSVKNNIVKFSDEAVWRELGKVVAVDIFNGNSDRFDTTTGRWVNAGNVMFLAGGQTTVIGLDTYNPYGGEHANLNRHIPNVAINDFGYLRTLNDVTTRHAFALACVRSVGVEMQREIGYSGGQNIITISAQGPAGPEIRKIEVATMDTLFLPFATDFEAGLAQGAQQLQLYLRSKLQKYAAAQDSARLRVGIHRVPVGGAQVPAKTVPQGIIDRMNYLGW